MEKTREPSKPLSEQPLIQQIDVILANNGNVPQTTKDNLMFATVKSLIVSITAIEENMAVIAKTGLERDSRIKTLEDRNIVTWCIRHPAAALFTGTLIGLLLVDHYGPLILKFLGVGRP